MKVLGKVSITVLIHAAALEMIATIFLCYGLAVALGHVPAWLPMISDCGVLPPEKYPFRLGYVLGATLIATQIVLTYNADRPYSKNKTALVLGLISCSALAVVGVVSEKESSTVHAVAGVVSFVCYEAYMVILAWFTGNNEGWNLASVIRRLCTIVAGISLITFAIMSTDRGKYSLYIAICEWVGVMCILCFNWSFIADQALTSIEVAEVREDTCSNKRNCALGEKRTPSPVKAS